MTIMFILKSKKETMCTYIDHFIQVKIVVRGLDESIKCLIFEKSLRPDSSLWEKLGREEAHNLNGFMSKEKSYINYEEKVLVEGGSR